LTFGLSRSVTDAAAGNPTGTIQWNGNGATYPTGSPCQGEEHMLEGTGSTTDDTLHLKRRLGLLSGVALIVGTMIGQ
jgi:solute carrier family 7 (L-type amino acid transporter), member 9/15